MNIINHLNFILIISNNNFFQIGIQCKYFLKFKLLVNINWNSNEHWINDYTNKLFRPRPSKYNYT